MPRGQKIVPYVLRLFGQVLIVLDLASFVILRYVLGENISGHLTLELIFSFVFGIVLIALGYYLGSASYRRRMSA